MRRALSLTIAMTAIMLALGAAPAAAQSFTLTATLSGASEQTVTTPAINTGAFGDCTIVLDLTARSLTYSVRVFNLPSGVTASHIHVGAPGTAGPVVVNFAPPVNASNDFGFTGTVLFTAFTLRPDQGIRSADDMAQAIIGGNTYCNVHSAVNGGGEVRGQFTVSR